MLPLIFALVLGVFLCTAAILFLLGFRIVAFPTTVLPLSGLLLFGAAALSAARTGFSSEALFGLGFEEGTVGFFLLFALAVFMASLVPRRYIPVFLYTLVGLSVLSIIVALGMFFISPPFFDSWVGSYWPQYAFLYGGALLTALLLLKDASSVRARGLLVVGALLLSAALFLIFGPYASFLSLRPDIRPSPYLTTLVAGEEYLQSLPTILLGTGPNSFAQVWEQGRPPELNKSAYGEGEFNFGYSSAATILVTLGVAGLAALLLSFTPAVLLLLGILRRLPTLKQRGALASSGLALFCLGALLFAVPGPAVFLLGAVALGFCSVFLQTSPPVRIAAGFLRSTLVAVPFLLIAAPLVYISQQQLRAVANHTKGVELLLQEKPEEASPFLLRAATLWSHSLYERDASRGALEAALAELARTEGQELPKTETFGANIDMAVEMAEQAVHSNPKAWKAWLAQASLYVALLKIKQGGDAAVNEFAQKVKIALTQAHQLSPTRPEIPYLYANLALLAGERGKAKEYLEQALTLKPTYEQAQALLRML